MACRVEEDAEGLPRLHLVLAGTEFEHGRLGGVEILDEHVEVQLLRMILTGPTRGVVVIDLLNAGRGPGIGDDLDRGGFRLVGLELPVEQSGVELAELHGVGGVDVMTRNSHAECDASTTRNRVPMSRTR